MNMKKSNNHTLPYPHSVATTLFGKESKKTIRHFIKEWMISTLTFQKSLHSYMRWTCIVSWLTLLRRMNPSAKMHQVRATSVLYPFLFAAIGKFLLLASASTRQFHTTQATKLPSTPLYRPATFLWDWWMAAQVVSFVSIAM